MQDVSFHLNEGDRTGIVGENGAGKSTLLNILTGEVRPDSGQFFIAGDKTTGYLKQRDNFAPGRTVIQEVNTIFEPLRILEREIGDLHERIAAADPSESKPLWTRLETLEREYIDKGGYTYKSEMAGITYFLVAARTKKSWALFVFCALTGVHGLYVPMIVCCLIAGVIAATLASKTSCTNERALTASYVVYMVLAAFGGMYVPFLFFSQQTLAQYSTQFGEDYMQLLSTIVSPAMAVAMLLVVALCAFLGSLIARKLLKKHFQKAGLV